MNSPTELRAIYRSRFWSKVAAHPAGCWLWMAGQDGKGYGTCWAGRPILAYRYAYEAAYGSVPAGLVLDHLCQNRICVNPAHLEPVTQAENARRGMLAKTPVTHCKRGHPFDEENTLHYLTSKGWTSRVCLACRKWRDGSRDRSRCGERTVKG